MGPQLLGPKVVLRKAPSNEDFYLSQELGHGRRAGVTKKGALSTGCFVLVLF